MLTTTMGLVILSPSENWWSSAAEDSGPGSDGSGGGLASATITSGG